MKNPLKWLYSQNVFSHLMFPKTIPNNYHFQVISCLLSSLVAFDDVFCTLQRVPNSELAVQQQSNLRQSEYTTRNHRYIRLICIMSRYIIPFRVSFVSKQNLWKKSDRSVSQSVSHQCHVIALSVRVKKTTARPFLWQQ